MPSPFPGMNPYLEQRELWRAVHSRFLVFLQDAIAPAIGPRYFVDLEDSLYVDRPRGRGRRLVGVADAAVTGGGADESVAAAVTAAPVTARVVLPGRSRHRRLVIRGGRGQTVVTVIEVLSPSNKDPGGDRDQYLAKRDEVLASDANLVEIDLLRGGRRPPVVDPPDSAYRVLVSRRTERPRVGLWPLGLRDELPAVPIPLRAADPEPTVLLKDVLDRVYDGANYEGHIYAGRPDPPLSAADADWARQFVPTDRGG